MSVNKNYLQLTRSEAYIEYEKILNEYMSFKSKNLKLDMSRGKPSPEQLDLSLKMMDVLKSDSNFTYGDGTDLRNYGMPYGVQGLKDLMSDLTGINSSKFIIGGNSSLSMMYDVISFFMLKGADGCLPWCKQDKIKFLCPSPGYDRHFAISEYFGMEMIPIKMTSSGPDMDTIEKLVKNDSSIKGMWCVPKYSNPQGITYSNDTIKRLASLCPLAKDFKIIWDNAYFIHDLCEGNSPPLIDFIAECEKYGNKNMPVVFFSTSKITFPGDGIAFLASSDENLKLFKDMYRVKTVGFDKINQLRHLLFLKDKNNVLEHMKEHRKILKPKFDIVIDLLESNFTNNPILSWNNPEGGYFVSIQTQRGCAKRVGELCGEAGVKLTNAGSTYPYGYDPDDSNIRIAPTYPSLNDLKNAMELLCICVKLAFLEKLCK